MVLYDDLKSTHLPMRRITFSHSVSNRKIALRHAELNFPIPISSMPFFPPLSSSSFSIMFSMGIP